MAQYGQSTDTRAQSMETTVLNALAYLRTGRPEPFMRLVTPNAEFNGRIYGENMRIKGEEVLRMAGMMEPIQSGRPSEDIESSFDNGDVGAIALTISDWSNRRAQVHLAMSRHNGQWIVTGGAFDIRGEAEPTQEQAAAQKTREGFNHRTHGDIYYGKWRSR